MHNKLIPTTEKLVNKQKNNLLYEEIINSDLKNILVSKKEQEGLMDFLEKRKQIGENYLEIDLLVDKQTFDEEGIKKSIISGLGLQKKILPVAWDKRKIWKKRLVPFLAGFLSFSLSCLFTFSLLLLFTKDITILTIIFLIVYVCVYLGLWLWIRSNIRLNPKNKLRDWWNRKFKLKSFELKNIELVAGFKYLSAKTNWQFGKKQTFIQYLIKKLLSGKTSVIILDLDTYPNLYLSNLLIYFKNITENYNETNSKKLTFFYLTSKDILKEYNEFKFDFYIYPISETNELVLKQTLENNYEMVNTLFSNFKNKFNLPIYEDTYSFLINYKKFYKTYENHFSLKEFFVILILKKYFYKYLQILITNKKEPNNTIDLSTFKTIINLEKVDSTKSLVSDSYNDIWKWAYSNSFFQIESENKIDFYNIFLTFFVIKLSKFIDLNSKCSCLEKYLSAVKEIINNKLAPCTENKITDKGLKLFIKENIGKGEKYNNFLNRVKDVAKNLHFSNNLLDSKDDYYKSLIKWIEEFVADIPELKNIYTNTLIKYHTNNNDHYIFILASFLNQIFKIKEINNKSVYQIIFKVLKLAKPNYYLKLKNIFFLLDQELQVYIINNIGELGLWTLDLDLLIVNDWLAVFSKNELQVFGIWLTHYGKGKLRYYGSHNKIKLILNTDANKFAIYEWRTTYCKRKPTK